MDKYRFDNLTRALVAPRTRRGLLAALGAGLLGIRAAGAACPSGQVLAAGNRCVCRSTGRPPVNGDCPCPAGQIRCNGACQPGTTCGCTPESCPVSQSCRGDGTCGCQPNEIQLANGTCAIACTADAQCGCGFEYCSNLLDGGGVCGGPGDDTLCNGTADCPVGQFCGPGGSCLPVCLEPIPVGCTPSSCPLTQSCLADGACGCRPGQVQLTNGTCADPCSSPDDCDSCVTGFCGPAEGGQGVCSEFGQLGPCNGTADCPLGTYCNNSICTAVCIASIA